MIYLVVAVMLFICIILCGVEVLRNIGNPLPYVVVSTLCGIGCILCVGLYFGGM